MLFFSPFQIKRGWMCCNICCIWFQSVKQIWFQSWSRHLTNADMITRNHKMMQNERHSPLFLFIYLFKQVFVTSVLCQMWFSAWSLPACGVSVSLPLNGLRRLHSSGHVWPFKSRWAVFNTSSLEVTSRSARKAKNIPPDFAPKKNI